MKTKKLHECALLGVYAVFRLNTVLKMFINPL